MTSGVHGDSGYPRAVTSSHPTGESPVPGVADTPAKRIGLFGGSFNPPHVAHQLVCTLALSVGGVDEVWLVPCYQHAFDKALVPFEDRLAMCRLAAEPFGARARVCDVERSLGGVSRTLVTLEHLRQQYPRYAWVLVVGADILAEAPRWHAWDRIRELADLYAVGRGEAPAEDGEDGENGVLLPDISSGDVRARLGRGQGVSGLVPDSVEAYISSRDLYS
jgi:nicotinate-nucleotide adenylyltransferase